MPRRVSNLNLARPAIRLLLARTPWLFHLCVCFFLLAINGCGEDRPPESTRRTIESIREDEGLVGRSIIPCETGDCILLHIPPSLNRLKHFQSDRAIHESPEEQDVTVKTLLQKDDDDEANDGRLVKPADRWGGEKATTSTLTTFNCCAYVMGDLLNLDSADWLDTRRSHANDPDAPIQVVLDSYFHQVQTYSTRNMDWQEFSHSSVLQENDLIGFVVTLGKKYRCIHIGFARKNGDAFGMESKVGIGPVVLATIEATARGYARKFDHVIVFRRNK